MSRAPLAIALGLAATLSCGVSSAQQVQPDPDETPLQRIQRMLRETPPLMQKVEDRLFDADAGERTQAEQKRIVEAMRFQDKTSATLEALIHEIENLPP